MGTICPRKVSRERLPLVLALVMGLGAGAMTWGGPLSVELHVGPAWTSHWSPRGTTPGTSVHTQWHEGGSAGMRLAWQLHPRWYGGAGVSYDQMGASHVVRAESFPYGPMHLSYRFEYLKLPLTIETRWVSSGPLTFSTCGGGYMAYALENSYTFFNEEKGTATHPLRDVQRWDMGFVTGAGVTLSLGRVSVTARYQYEMGLKDLSLNTDPLSIPEFHGVLFPIIRLRNLSHGLLVGVGVPL